MKSLFVLLLVMATSLTATAKKAYYSMEMLINKSDLIVVGEITKTHIGSYTFKIAETLKGKEQESIKVQMFKDWTCDVRSRPAEVGQKIALFLKRKAGKYEIINGSTGEIFIDEGVVQFWSLDIKPTVPEFNGMINDFLASFEVKNDPDTIWNRIFYTQLLSDDEITELRNKSKYTDWLIGRIEEDQISK